MNDRWRAGRSGIGFDPGTTFVIAVAPGSSRGFAIGLHATTLTIVLGALLIFVR